MDYVAGSFGEAGLATPDVRIPKRQMYDYWVGKEDMFPNGHPQVLNVIRVNTPPVGP